MYFEPHAVLSYDKGSATARDFAGNEAAGAKTYFVYFEPRAVLSYDKGSVTARDFFAEEAAVLRLYFVYAEAAAVNLCGERSAVKI